MTRFPTVETLAAATPADVLRAWQGLGYNRRALNLWRAASRIVTDFDGVVPADPAALESLPGVGPYTARAVAAFAYGAAVGAVDTNVRRVLGRIAVGAVDVLTAAEIQRLADAVVPPLRSGPWNHALMDIGATICRPVQPDCDACPAMAWCRHATERPSGREMTVPSRLAPAVGAGRRHVPFPQTSRWLRGRIVDRLRSAGDGAWVEIDAPIGDHDANAVKIAVETLARDGLLETDGATTADGRIRARLPIA